MRPTVSSLVAFAALIAGLLAVPASAAAPPAKTTTKTSNPTVTTLHQIKTLLDTAIHDYDGHRAKAVEEVHHAIKELSPHHTTTHKAAKTGTAASGTKQTGTAASGAKQTTTPGETQAQSDAQLKEALQLLNALAESKVSNAKTATHISNAITELNTALKMK